MSGWQSISSAPRDGTLIQVRDGDYSPCHAKLVDSHWRFLEDVSFLPTHWQAVPVETASLLDSLARKAERLSIQVEEAKTKLTALYKASLWSRVYDWFNWRFRPTPNGGAE